MRYFCQFGSFEAEECRLFKEFIIISLEERSSRCDGKRQTLKGLIPCTHGFARGHVAARLYYGSLDTLEQARDEALQQSYINAIAEQANASLNPSSSTSSSPAAVAVVSPSLGPDELSNSESEA